MKFKRLLLMALAVIFLVGCQPTTTPTPEAASESGAAAKEPVSQEKLDEIGTKLVAAVMENDSDSVNKYMDYDALVERILAPFNVDADVKAGFSEGFTGELQKKPMGLFAEMVGSKVKFIKSHYSEDQSRVLIRVIAPEDIGGFQFVDLIVENRSGTPKVVDYYTYFGGELISDALGRLLGPALLKAGTSGGEGELEKVEDLQRLFAAIQSRDWKKADKIYRAMDSETAEKKFVQLMYLQVAVELSDEIYLEALEKFEKDFPDDPSLVLVQIDTFFLKKEYQKVVDGLDGLQESLEIQDAYVKTLQATALAESGQSKEALELLKSAVKLEPELEDTRWALIELAMGEDDFQTVADNLDALLPEYPDLVYGVPSEDFYKPFMNSQTGKDWLAKAEG